MKDTLDKVWGEVALTLNEAVAIAWDTCHKIYVIMDEAQVQKMIGYGYEDDMIKATDSNPKEMLNTLQDWYANSCALKFIQAVSTVEGDPNNGFDSLIPQGFFDLDEDEDEDYQIYPERGLSRMYRVRDACASASGGNFQENSREDFLS